MADQIGISLSRSIVNEGSVLTATVDFRDRATATASTPSTVEYKIYNKSSDVVVRDWTLVTAASNLSVDLGALVNGIQHEANRTEKVEFLVAADRGMSTEIRGVGQYTIQNVAGYVYGEVESDINSAVFSNTLALPALTDYVHVIDRSDTTGSPDGTPKLAPISGLPVGAASLNLISPDGTKTLDVSVNNFGSVDWLGTGEGSWWLRDIGQLGLYNDGGTESTPPVEANTTYAQYAFWNVAEDALGQMGFNTSSTLSIDNYHHGAHVAVTAENSSGVQKSCFNFDPNVPIMNLGGGTKLGLNSTGSESATIEQTATILKITGDIANSYGIYFHDLNDVGVVQTGTVSNPAVEADSPSASFSIWDENSRLLMWSGFASSSTYLIGNEIYGGHLKMYAHNTSAVEKTMFEYDPDTEVTTFPSTVAFNSGVIFKPTRKTTTYTILITDSVLFGNTDGGAWTATLPAGAEGQNLRVINSGSSGNNLTLAPNGSEHLIGANTNFELTDGESLELTYNATDGWY